MRHLLSLKAAAGQFPRPAGDWVLRGLGISAATVSASFAGYMVVIGPGLSGPHTGFPVLAAFDRRPHRLLTSPPEVSVPPSPAPAARADAGLAPDLDFTPTGTVTPAAQPSQRAGVSPKAPLLTTFTIRDVFDGKALIETRNRLELVGPGAILQGAGQVLAIRRGEKGWVVETTGGVVE